MKVIVLGAGVVGVTTAYFLARSGHEVMVLEKNSASAMGCSYANGGQLSYSHIEPWASKNSLKTIIKAAFLSPSFLSISDFANPKFWRWSFDFVKNSKSKVSQDNARKIFSLTSSSKKILESLMQEEPDLRCDYKNDGILHFFRTRKTFEIAVKEAQRNLHLGLEIQILNAEECVKKEPTLAKLKDKNKLAGGIFYPQDASGDAALFTQSLEKICREKYGVTFHFETEVKNLFTNYKKITGINTTKGVFVGDKYIYALGANSNKMLEGIGLDAKIYPLKGYSLSVKTSAEFLAPQMALTDCENKIVYSRIGNIFRVAGTIEACGNKAQKNQKHIDFLKIMVRATFSDFGNLNESSEWFGFRPFRANSIPLICNVKKYGNLILNTGHGSLGWSLSAISAKVVSDLVLEKKAEQFTFLHQEETSLYNNKK